MEEGTEEVIPALLDNSDKYEDPQSMWMGDISNLLPLVFGDR